MLSGWPVVENNSSDEGDPLPSTRPLPGLLWLLWSSLGAQSPMLALLASPFSPIVPLIPLDQPTISSTPTLCSFPNPAVWSVSSLHSEVPGVFLQ